MGQPLLAVQELSVTIVLMAMKIVSRVKEVPGKGSEANESRRDVTNGEPMPTLLTPRQKRVLVYLMAGKQNKEIAGELKVKEQTVKNEMRDVLGYFGITHTRELFPIIDQVKQALSEMRT